jgi:hypothetical protein
MGALGRGSYGAIDLKGQPARLTLIRPNEQFTKKGLVCLFNRQIAKRTMAVVVAIPFWPLGRYV